MGPNQSTESRDLEVDRRSVLRTLGGSRAVVALGTAVGAGEGAVQDARSSAIKGNQCTPVTPLSGNRTVEELYDLRIPDE